MPIINAILGELEQESPVTLRVLERVPSDKLAWTPHPKSMTLGALAWHIASIPAIVQRLLLAGTFDLSRSRRGTDPPESTAAVIEHFRRNMDELRTFLPALDDATLKEPFTMTRGETQLATFPKIGVLRSILLNHTYHHRGQLALYLRLLDVPVPAIYGQSADEAI
jgi:uncharacterized damage-inducible protein DinB